MTPTLLLRCGCQIAFREQETPICPTHGNQAVVRVLHMPAPTFRGTVTGPHAQPQDLGAWTGRIVGSDTAKDT